MPERVLLRAGRTGEKCPRASTGLAAAAIVAASMAKSKRKPRHELTPIRDTIESIWVAIVLAFVLRAFLVEAFVIPTGSMAPRLYGEHLDVRCPACGYDYAFGRPSEPEEEDERSATRPGAGRTEGGRRLAGATCPNCGHDDQPRRLVAGGDRVLVMKYLYRFRPPQPWDVIVFKNPQDNRQHYIKRLIGLPGEAIEIVHGNVFVGVPDEPASFRIRRKDKGRVQEAMWQVVFDNDYRPSGTAFGRLNAGRYRAARLRPPFWKEVGPGPSRWGLDDCYGRWFTFRGGEEAELVFRGNGSSFLPRYGYNSRRVLERQVDRDTDVVSDLKLSVAYVPKGRDSRLNLTLSSFEHVFRGEVGADGLARLLYRRTTDSKQRPWTIWGQPARLDPLPLNKVCEVALCHVDFRVTLHVGGKPVLRSVDRQRTDPPDDRSKYPLNYDLLKARLAEVEAGGRAIPQPEVKIAAAGGACELRHVRLLRDVHYTSPPLRDDPPEGPLGDFARGLGVWKEDHGWGVMGHPIVLRKYPNNPDLDQYFVLGDNSPSSLDGRAWVSAAPTLRLYDEAGDLGEPTLGVADIRWPEFLATVKGHADAEEPWPGKQLWSLWDAELRRKVSEGLEDKLIDERLKRLTVGELNRVLAEPGLYSKAVWGKAALPEQAPGPAAKRESGQALTSAEWRQLKTAELARRSARGEKLTPSEWRELNRAALDAAFPGLVLRRRRIYQLGTVPRYSLIGKAFFVYWPSGFPLPGLGRLPIIPNVGRMRLIR